MNTALIILLLAAMFSVLLVLALGIYSMLKGGEFNEKYGNRLMQARVALQGVALALLALAYFASQG
ncbi:MAG: twin transmembrane helix small protein [Alphaproteobacteria bacterium]|nr:twin transmembrane helix small protein [Alphaproteobacteria bacterium]